MIINRGLPVWRKKPNSYCFSQCRFLLFSLFPDVDDEYEDEDQWEDGAEDILEKGRADRLPVLKSEIQRALDVRIDQDLAKRTTLAYFFLLSSGSDGVSDLLHLPSPLGTPYTGRIKTFRRLVGVLGAQSRRLAGVGAPVAFSSGLPPAERTLNRFSFSSYYDWGPMTTSQKFLSFFFLCFLLSELETASSPLWDACSLFPTRKNQMLL